MNGYGGDRTLSRLRIIKKFTVLEDKIITIQFLMY